MLRKIAIVGANGFVGRHVVILAGEQGVTTLGVVRSEAGAEIARSLGALPFQIDGLTRAATQSLAASLKGCDGLVYLASVSEGPQGVDRTDPSGLVNVLDACREAGVPRVVFFSGLGVARYGMNPHCTNPYFLAKMAGEVALFRSGLFATVFRPSYIFGAGDEFLSPLSIRVGADPVIEIPGRGDYRLQPISVQDTARAVLGALQQDRTGTRVIDLVGPEILSYRALVLRLASAMGRLVEIRERPLEEALAQARASQYFGLRPFDLACLLCDEVSDSRPVEALLGTELDSLDALIATTLSGLRESETPA
jgi:NADH dehydrogenase